jgi:hypothetical protein
LPPVGHHRRQTTEADFAAPGLFKRHRRSCLGCRTQFDSEWAGERICQRCKATTAWRNGASTSVTSSNQNQSRSGRKGGS